MLFQLPSVQRTPSLIIKQIPHEMSAQKEENKNYVSSDDKSRKCTWIFLLFYVSPHADVSWDMIFMLNIFTWFMMFEWGTSKARKLSLVFGEKLITFVGVIKEVKEEEESWEYIDSIEPRTFYAIKTCCALH